MSVAVNASRDVLRRRKRRSYIGPWLPTPIDTSNDEVPPSYEPIVEGIEFAPRSPNARIPASLNAVQKQHVIDNGTYNPDGTVNMRTALRLGWNKVWAPTDHPAKVAPADAEKK